MPLKQGMANDFKEYAEVLAMQQQELADITRNLSDLSHPDFDALGIRVGGVDRMDLTADQVFDMVHIKAREEESLRNLTLVKNCLDKMKITMGLLKAQETFTWLADTYPSAQARSCLVEDNKMMGELSQQLVDLKKFHEEQDLPIMLDRQSYFDNFLAVVEDYKKYTETSSFEHIQAAKDFQQASSLQNLLEQIYELRLDYLDTAVEDSATIVHGMKSKLWEAACVRVAVDEGIIPDSPFARKMVSDNLDHVRKTLPVANENLAAINRFMAGLYEMGDDDWGTKDFEVKEYQPVNLALLPVIKP